MSGCIRPLPGMDSFPANLGIFVAPESDIRLGGTDLALFNSINTMVFFVYSMDGCQSLVDSNYGSLAAISTAALVAVRKSNADMPNLEHPDDIEGDYFIYTFEGLPPGEYSLMAFGVTDNLFNDSSMVDAGLGTGSAEEEINIIGNLQPDESLTFDSPADIIENIPAESIAARSCVQLQLEAGQTMRRELILLPYNATGDNVTAPPSPSNDAGFGDSTSGMDAGRSAASSANDSGDNSTAPTSDAGNSTEP